MELVIIDKIALSEIDMTNLKECNREHYTITVVVVDSNGNSQRFKPKEETVEYVISDIPSKYIIIR